ncbi:MAG: hypothetical protein AB1499_15300 [Nitrospirota bacterium]
MAGYKVHYNKGVWWQEYAPFFYKPVLHLQKLSPTETNPKFFRSFLGFKHLVVDDRTANGTWPMMVLPEAKLKDYSISTIDPSKRGRVRKGLKLTEVTRIEDIEAVIGDIKEICISTAIRTGHGLPPTYYSEKFEEWRAWITKELSQPKREWWGAFNEGRVIAYIYSVQIDDTMFMYTAKSHTEHLEKCPNDALIFTFLNYCRELPDCRQVIFGDGGPTAPTVNTFKIRLGFEEILMPVYARYNPLVLACKKGKSYISRRTG